MDKRIRLLDCTLRDGAYIVNAKFGAPAIKGIVNKMQEANVDIIECGWLKNAPYEQGTTYYHVPGDFEQYLTKKNPVQTYTVMIDWDRYDLDYLPEYDGKSIDAIRVVFPHGRHNEGTEVGRKIKEKGYQVFFQAANTLSYSDEDLVDLARAVNSVKPVSLSIVDTFGAMYEEDLDRIIAVLDRELSPDIQLGFHSHNNQQMSFSLTIHFIKTLMKTERKIVVDASLCGMGRGAGNATTELVVSYLDRKCGCHYDMDAIMNAIDVYMEYFKENYEWGYSTPYFIAGMYCCHVNNIAYLLKNHRTNAKDMRNIIESLSPADRLKYDYDLLEQKYLKNQSYYVDDTAAVEALKQAFLGKNVTLVAPGKLALESQQEVLQHIADRHSIVIGINAILPGYQYDYLFFSNPARYDFAQSAHGEVFRDTKRIVLSNIRNTPDDGELVIGFDTVIKRGWTYYDNATICCLRLMERIGMDKVSLAGFDGFKTKYNESYADPFLPSLNPAEGWDKLNEETREIYRDFKETAVKCKEIEFITPSIFDV